MKNDNNPSFIVAGFPKCGTSFLHRKLNEHKHIWMPDFEPVHFGTDINSNSLFKDIDSYTQIFKKYRDSDNIVTGEKSSGYAYSDFAMEAIYKYKKNTKIIITLRNPIDAVISYHNHNVRMGYEPIIDLENALLAQENRKEKKGNYKIPFFAKKEKKRYEYFNIYSYPKKIEYILDLFGKDNVRIILLDDIINNPEKVMSKLFSFLGVDEIKQSFTAVNIKKPLVDHNKLKVRLFYFIHYSNRYIRNNNSKNYFLINPIIRIILLGILRFSQFFTKHPYESPSSKYQIENPPKRVYSLLAKKFSNDIDELSLLLKRDLSDWKVYEE